MTSKKIRFVTDSTCDLPPDLIEKHHIGVVPCFVNFGGQSYADNGIDITREDFYTRLPDIHPSPKTAAPPPAVAEKVIHETFEGADHLVIVTAPARLSAIYNSMRLGASKLPQDRVTLVDSLTVTMGLGWQVLIAAEVAEVTSDLDKVLDAIKRVRDNQKTYAILATMRYLQSSGRISWAAASIGALLQIKPVLKVGDSEVAAISRVRTFKRAVEEIVTLTKAEAPLDRLAILHTNNLEGAQELKEHLGEIAPSDTIFTNVTTVIGTHVGPGALGVATVSERWKQG